MSRSCLVSWLAVLLFLNPGAALCEPELPDPALRANVTQVMHGRYDEQSITAFVGAPVLRCVPTSPSTKLCQWDLSGRASAWRDLARAIDTGDRIALLCELRTDGGAPVADACSAHPQRSNRDQFPLRSRRARRKGQISAGELKRIRGEYQQVAQTWLAAAPTLTDVSRLIGATPDSCVPTSQDHQRCLWKTSSRTYGQGTAAMLIPASTGKKIRLYCVFPQSGGARDEECIAQVGA